MSETPKLYYTNARYGGKTLLLAGPFLDVGQAEHCIDICGPMAIEFDPMLEQATFGVMEVNGYAGAGMFNDILRINGIQGIISIA